MNQSFASDYIDVATRIAEVRGDAERHYPDGSFQAWEPFRMVEVDGATYVAYTAAFYRTPDDPRPGIGSAWEQVPGKTAFTRGSELQNAETSAWGRALIAALAADSKKGIASADEVRARQAERDPEQHVPASGGRECERCQKPIAGAVEVLGSGRYAHKGGCP